MKLLHLKFILFSLSLLLLIWACSSKGEYDEEADYLVKEAAPMLEVEDRAKEKKPPYNEEELQLYHHPQKFDIVLLLGDYHKLIPMYEMDNNNEIDQELIIPSSMMNLVQEYVQEKVVEKYQSNVDIRFVVMTDLGEPAEVDEFYNRFLESLADNHFAYPYVYLNPIPIKKDQGNFKSMSQAQMNGPKLEKEDLITMLSKTDKLNVVESLPEGGLNLENYREGEYRLGNKIRENLRLDAKVIFIHIPTRKKRKQTMVAMNEIISDNFGDYKIVKILTERYDLMLADTGPQIYKEMIDELFIQYTQYLYLDMKAKMITSMKYYQDDPLVRFDLDAASYSFRNEENTIQILSSMPLDITFVIRYAVNWAKMDNNNDSESDNSNNDSAMSNGNSNNSN